jgi:predicted dithiol-disulfide oxidoreductase (DUF899 family)
MYLKRGAEMTTSAIEKPAIERPVIAKPKIVSEAEWVAARKVLLAQEKALTHARDAVSEARRKLPWVRVEKEYVFDTVDGPKTLAELFDGRSQLIVYHFMWRKDLGEGCVGCSFLGDHIDGANLHLPARDVTLVVVSRAPLEVLQTFRKRMGWRFDWASSEGSDFNFDYHVSFRPEELESGEVGYNFTRTKASIEELSGISVFYKSEDGEIFHTYSSYARGNEEVLGTYMYLDLVPKGRDEGAAGMGLWVRHHDRYGAGGYVDASGGYIAAEKPKACCAGKEHASA